VSRAVILTPEAEDDIKEAFGWYEGREPNLGRSFIMDVDIIFSRITDAPHHFPIIYRGLRRALLNRFPYSVYFLDTDDMISIIAVLSQRRNPEILVERVDDN